MRNILLYILSFLVIGFNFADAKVLYTWSQVVQDGKLSVRAIVDDDVCPVAYVDNNEAAMSERCFTKYEGGTEKVCELLVQQGVRDISIDGIQIPVLPKKISKIAFIGDTGCRINMLYQQECNSLESWPLKKNLDSITLHKPDLVIHVGDYHYRSGRCRNVDKCGSVYGYNAQAWYSDWFEPTKNIALQSPFLFVRGNHESCDRAYNGWFKYLDSYPYLHEKCESFVSSWFLDIGPMKFFVFDSSSGDDMLANNNQVEVFNKQFSKVIQDPSNKPIWFLTHRPLWRSPKREFLTLKNNGNLAQVEAFGDNFPSNVTTIVSGHIHIAQILLMDNAPDQIIVGNGGALLHAQNQKPTYYNMEFNYLNNRHYLAREVRNFFGFGFAILNLDNHTFAFYDQNNEEVYSTQLTDNFKIATTHIKNTDF
ncbi:MAG: metallophosphoesterase [Wolbachia endosymbiont of Tyrophagus putrescentiae]|nr:metallophosphoesterase [Wolbachia endosymbiont of Tyrophagus putrescentiae]